MKSFQLFTSLSSPPPNALKAGGTDMVFYARNENTMFKPKNLKKEGFIFILSVFCFFKEQFSDMTFSVPKSTFFLNTKCL